MAQKCEHCDVSEANSDLQELLKEAEKRIAEQECAKTKLMDDVILLQNKFLEVKTQKSELKAQVMKAIPKEKDLRTSDNYDNEKKRTAYNEAITEITTALTEAWKGIKMPKRRNLTAIVLKDNLRHNPSFKVMRINISNKIREARLSKGITQEQMEKDLNLGKGQCSRIEQAFQSPNIFTLFIIFDYLGYDLSIAYTNKLTPPSGENKGKDGE